MYKSFHAKRRFILQPEVMLLNTPQTTFDAQLGLGLFFCTFNTLK